MRSLSKEEIELLAEKKLSGNITPEEQTVLSAWLNRLPDKGTVWLSGDEDASALRSRLLKQIKEEAGIPPRRMRKIQNYWWAAAAILLLIAGSLSYFRWFKQQAAPLKIARNNMLLHDVAPGHNGAILTLANGRRIILDSAGSGKIASQGSLQLVKQNGSLTYQERTNSAAQGSDHDHNNKVIYNTITTLRGRQFEIVLSDGSKVWLNAASSITYPVAFGTERKVSVTGEVYFEIAKDFQHPFIVSVDNAQVAVLGTHFDVMDYPDEKAVRTTLLEGSVRVTHDGQQVTMTPGQQAIFSDRSGISVVEVNTEQVVAWVNGQLSLDDLNVQEIMRKVSRWYNIDVEYEGPVPHERFWGIIDRNVNLSAVLKIMNANGINTRLEGHKVIVSF